MRELAGWESFYVIVGSSAGALIGLQFVVIALLAETRRRSTTKEIDAFATPTILHLCAALLVSAILSAPWLSLLGPRVALGITGAAGLVYMGIVIRRTIAQIHYRPVLEDWLWHATFPFIAYAVLALGAFMLRRHPVVSLFVIAGTSLLLLFIAIHNAWDTVTFIALDQMQPRNAPSKPEST
ncbi:MAG: hypothetical protein DMF86_19150 [Acidobacteria bacterium]|nr:MAG: hypothetical protein DMF86_19150 [Acidobacteriota bacterium]